MRGKKTDDGIWLSKAGREGFADIVDGTILGPSRCDDGIEVLFRKGSDMKGGKNEVTDLCFWRRSLWFAGVLDDLFE